MNLSNRQKQIVLLLLHTSRYVTSEDIAQEFNISTKTVHRDVSAINLLIGDANHTIQSSRGKGYRIPQEAKEILWKTYIYPNNYDNNVLPDVQQTRIDWILRKLSNNVLNNQSLTQRDLEATLYVSESTIKRDLELVKQILDQYQLTLSTDYRNGFVLEGRERNIRKLITSYVLEDDSHTNIRLTDTHKYVSAEIINRIILKHIKNHKVILTDIGFKNLSMHIDIALSRIERGLLTVEKQDLVIHPENPEYLCSLDIVNDLEAALGIEIPPSEIMNIYIHLSSQKKLQSVSQESTQTLDIVDKTLIQISQLYGFDFTEDAVLKHGLSVHLESALRRVELGLEIENELLEAITHNYPFELQLAKQLSLEFKKRLNINFNDDEVGFLTLHFCGARERYRSVLENGLTRAMIVCSTGLGTATLLKAKLESKMKHKLQIVGVMASYQLNMEVLESVDMIISTIALKRDFGKRVVLVSGIVSDQDIINIKDALANHYSNPTLQDLFDQKLFLTKLDIKTPEALIEMMSQIPLQLGYIDTYAQQSLAKRESLGSTEVGNGVAIPHNFEGKVYRPCIVVAILPEPIQWHYGEVQLVFMILMDNNAKHLYSEMFSRIYAEIDRSYKVNKIIEHRDIDYIQSLFED